LLLAINPYDRTVWWTENIPIMIIVFLLAVTYNKFQFSNTSYLLMSVLIFMHTIGGYYTFARVPFDFVTNFFGFERNNYDRLAHFSVGFYTYAFAEYLNVKKAANEKWIIYVLPLVFIMALAGAYEIFEWIYAITGDPTAGIEVLGSQGDIWDAQKDMLSDTLGAIVALIFFKLSKKKLSKNSKEI